MNTQTKWAMLQFIKKHKLVSEQQLIDKFADGDRPEQNRVRNAIEELNHRRYLRLWERKALNNVYRPNDIPTKQAFIALESNKRPLLKNAADETERDAAMYMQLARYAHARLNAILASVFVYRANAIKPVTAQQLAHFTHRGFIAPDRLYQNPRRAEQCRVIVNLLELIPPRSTIRLTEIEKGDTVNGYSSWHQVLYNGQDITEWVGRAAEISMHKGYLRMDGLGYNRLQSITKSISLALYADPARLFAIKEY